MPDINPCLFGSWFAKLLKLNRFYQFRCTIQISLDRERGPCHISKPTVQIAIQFLRSVPKSGHTVAQFSGHLLRNINRTSVVRNLNRVWKPDHLMIRHFYTIWILDWFSIQISAFSIFKTQITCAHSPSWWHIKAFDHLQQIQLPGTSPWSQPTLQSRYSGHTNSRALNITNHTHT